MKRWPHQPILREHSALSVSTQTSVTLSANDHGWPLGCSRFSNCPNRDSNKGTIIESLLRKYKGEHPKVAPHCRPQQFYHAHVSTEQRPKCAWRSTAKNEQHQPQKPPKSSSKPQAPSLSSPSLRGGAPVTPAAEPAEAHRKKEGGGARKAVIIVMAMATIY